MGTGIAIAASCAVFAEETVYVQSFKTTLFATPQFGAAVVVDAKRGDALTLLESRERWSRVRRGNHSGWVPSLAVSRHLPLRPAALLESAGDTSLPANARRRASGATTAGAARGLTYEDRQRADKAGIANYAAMERMERLSVTEEEALAFVASGLKQ
jgi:hypothetical protein